MNAELKAFNAKYLVSTGNAGECDYQQVYNTYSIPKKRMEQPDSIYEIFRMLPSYYDEILEKNITPFKRFYLRIPVYSDYDCTGQLCGYSRSVFVLNAEYEWIVVTKTTYSYDY